MDKDFKATLVDEEETKTPLFAAEPLLYETLEALGIELTELSADESGTLRSLARPRDPIEEAQIQALPALMETPAEIVEGETIGMGGMGVIQLAEQSSLKRKVAIKRLRTEIHSKDTTASLLSEAWVLGQLEHPNIIPVHILGRDDQGQPVFVLKHIEGVTWNKLMFRKDHPIREDDGRDHLEWNIEILMQVCNAAHYAHSKGIIHRDLKPGNVMVGAFGEVYVLDWGLAVSLRPEDHPHIPQARDIRGVEGTPAYMAPEMALAQTDQIQAHTDVYQLGAILHKVLTGKSRHTGDCVEQKLLSAVDSEPFDYDEAVPKELVGICQRATHPDPQQRFESAAALRQALSGFLQHRHSMELCARAQARHLKLQRKLARSSAREKKAEIYALSQEVLFGYRQALELWEGNQEARADLEKLEISMCRFEIALQDLSAASRRFPRIQSPSPELRAQFEVLQKLQHSEETRRKELEVLEFEHDLQVEIGSRAHYALWFSGAMFLLTMAMAQLDRRGIVPFTYQVYLASVALMTGCISFLTWKYRELQSNLINARMLRMFWLLVAIGLIVPLVAWKLRLSPHQSVVLTMLAVVAYQATFVLLLLERFAQLPLVTLACLLGALLWPSYTLEWGIVGLCAVPFLIGLVWHRDAAQGRHVESQRQ